MSAEDGSRTRYVVIREADDLGSDGRYVDSVYGPFTRAEAVEAQDVLRDAASLGDTFTIAVLHGLPHLSLRP